ncbi:MAG: hypothetical protein AAF411_17755 [Myxococcota bacterium]
MASSLARVALAAAIFSGCGRARLVDDPLPDLAVPTDSGRDGGVGVDRGVVDRGVDLARPDVARPDLSTDAPDDIGEDLPVRSGPLLDALTCSLNREGALRAAVRYGACSDDGVRGAVTAREVFEAWQGFVLGQGDLGATRLPVPACPFWQCVADAESCEDYLDCENVFTCDGSFQACAGDLLRFCRPDSGPPIRGELDCEAFGGECAEGACVGVDDACRFDAASEPILFADGDGLGVNCTSARVACAEGPGVYVLDRMGTAVPWCGPAASGPPDSEFCNGDVLTFPGLRGELVEVNCTDFGYSRCSIPRCLE